MSDLIKDIEAMRKECFTIEAGLKCFNVSADEPMTSEEAVRHALYLARTRIDEAMSIATKHNITYSFINRYPS